MKNLNDILASTKVLKWVGEPSVEISDVPRGLSYG